MQDFTFHVPTKILFGDQAQAFGQEVAKFGHKALLVYGGGSIKKNGIYEEVTGALKQAGVEVVELPGVQPNPLISKCEEGIKICHEQDIEVIVPVGGGSSIDSAKLIAAGAKTPGDPWKMVTGELEITAALPICPVLTLAATGSEMDTAAVITNPETQQKLGFGSPLVLPKVSLMNPAYTSSVNAWHTAAGVADIMSHTLENYFTVYDDAYLQDSMAEAVLRTCVHYGPIALKEPQNLEARANIMWASSWAINGLLNRGKHTAWSVHAMEHELSAFYDITHGVGLAILTPRWLEHVLNDQTQGKIARFGRRVFDLQGEDDQAVAKNAIQALYDFFLSLGIPMQLRDVGIDDTKLAEMAERCLKHTEGPIQGFQVLNQDDVLGIYKASL